ncbi:4-alpha-glucanotransferase [Plesiocystis pacifica SIR-1]|uniref:4-alpha-glucanotransferase n=1 Tax=Plesiocystis pacifica SIR-1 TaxID=391625 RepID=A6GHM9_9BACT|nr:4-alpha-glucanotransferase [Plesiocystis pacifica]EDM74609.1 4-alpha-glucanotransferase [Plesiocystis pacifica SIR-1]
MSFPRESGVLLHPTSLPGPHGIGDLGPSARHFVDWLVSAGQRLWQVLPLNPIGPGNSPYASVSAFAGSPLLVALEPLVEAGDLEPIAAEELAQFHGRAVDFGRVIPWRMAKLRAAAARFFARPEDDPRRVAFAAYVAAEADWLDDYALFMALDEHLQAASGEDFLPWSRWPAELARREPEALAAARVEHAEAVAFWGFVQFCFDSQWAQLRAYANERGVALVGDLPIFVAWHGADCWSRPELYRLGHGEAGLEPAVVAGVPPDFFSETGQRWGNPLYDWEAMAADGYRWWIARMRRQLALADRVRIDHFRGFSAYWEIPADCPTAMEGEWVPGPGAALFQAFVDAFGDALPVIAEDLGVITEEVEALRDQFALPGMKILQFAFAGANEAGVEASAGHAFLPHTYGSNCVVYTGTHDNDTVRGWAESAPEAERDFARRYFGCSDAELPWAMTRAALGSVANTAIIPFQDVLGLDGSHRMNVPGQTECWTWRFDWDMVGAEPARFMRDLCAVYGRLVVDTGS